MHAPDVPGLDLPDIDITGIASSYGIPAARVDTLGALTSTVRAALASDAPCLIEVPQRQLGAG